MFMAFLISSCPSEESVSHQEDDSVNVTLGKGILVLFRPYTNLMQL